MLDIGSGTFESEQIGSFFSFEKTDDAFGVSLIGEARIPKRNPELCETIRSMYDAGSLNFSFEILAQEVTEQDGVRVIDAAEGNELIGMAVVSLPAYPEATALSLVAETEAADAPPPAEPIIPPSIGSKKEGATDMEETNQVRQLETVQAEIAELKTTLAEKDTAIGDRDKQLAVLREQLAAQEVKLAEMETDLTAIRTEKDEAVKEVKRVDMRIFAQVHQLSLEDEAVAKAIENVDHAALMAESLAKKPAPAPVMAAYAMTTGLNQDAYGGLLDRG